MTLPFLSESIKLLVSLSDLVLVAITLIIRLQPVSDRAFVQIYDLSISIQCYCNRIQ